MLPLSYQLVQFIGTFAAFNVQPLPACDSGIFCHGPLLDAAQSAGLYNDSKSFVDMKLKHEENITLAAFQQLNASNEGNITDQQMKDFVNQYFSPPGSEYEEWTPSDWTANPGFLSGIADSSLRDWASELNALWKVLGRKMVDDVSANPSLYTSIVIPNPVIVPGGRFREFYYWDTYWVARGLLLSEMTSTIKGMLQNYLSMVDQFGFVPNGGRNYYQRRSQPPFLTPMFKDYVDATGDVNFLKAALPVLEKEYQFWMQKRSTTVDGHVLNRYASDVNQPRPESYREDKDDVKDFSQEEKMTLLTQITSACESGWDFSTRWAGIQYNPSVDVIQQLQTRDIIPVDLNSVLALNERILSEFHRMIGNESAAMTYENNYTKRAEAMEALLWNDTDGTYYDYVLSAGQHNVAYYASNLSPLWTKCYHSSVDVARREERLYQYLQKTGVLNYPGGIPTSLQHSGEQWDFPNAWPPLVHMIIEGMEKSNVPALKNEAFIQAQKWIRSNYKAYMKTNAMFEKYDVTESEGVPGKGGEYDVQKGFGWTNGVILSFLDTYGGGVTANDTGSSTSDGVTEMTPSLTTSGTAAFPALPRLIIVILAILSVITIM